MFCLPGIHLSHPPAHHGCLLQALLQLLLPQLLLDVQAERHRAFRLLHKYIDIISMI
jgi:uncharacterized membrane protein